MAKNRAATPAIRALERAGVVHTIHPYELGPQADEMTYGEAVAEAVGVESSRLFKTLVAVVDGDAVVAIVPVDGTLDTKALARSASGKRAEMAPTEVAERLTGYVVGGISPFGQKRRLRTIVDSSIHDHERVLVSAGRRGLQVEVAPDDLIDVTGGSTAPIAARGGA